MNGKIIFSTVLQANGTKVGEWCQIKNVNPAVLYRVLSGSSQNERVTELVAEEAKKAENKIIKMIQELKQKKMAQVSN